MQNAIVRIVIQKNMERTSVQIRYADKKLVTIAMNIIHYVSRVANVGGIANVKKIQAVVQVVVQVAVRAKHVLHVEEQVSRVHSQRAMATIWVMESVQYVAVKNGEDKAVLHICGLIRDVLVVTRIIQLAQLMKVV